MFLVAFGTIRNAFCHRLGIVVMFALIMILMTILIAHGPGGGAGEPDQRLPRRAVTRLAIGLKILVAFRDGLR